MSRIKTVSAETPGIRGFLARLLTRQYGGFLPGILQVSLVDLKLRPLGKIYRYLHLRKDSPFTRLQREMVATVVNGAIGGTA